LSIGADYGDKGVGIMNSMAFSLSANSSAEVNENQETELTIGSFSILIGHSGLTRLSDSTKPDPSAREPETVVMSESPVSLGEAKTTEGDNSREKLDLEETKRKTHNSTRDFAAGSSGVSKRVHQLCIIITEAEDENNNEGVDKQVDKVKECKKKDTTT
jgi:hypothetical protein